MSLFKKELLDKVLREHEERKRLPAKHPKVNSFFDNVKYDHSSSKLGIALGVKEEQILGLSDKFKKAEQEAKAQGGANWPSRMLEILMPTLTPEEIVFCTSFILSQKLI